MIDGRFELIDQLGSGGMGTVWRALDLALHREVALKEVRTGDPQDQDQSKARMLRERVLLEARALARLHHPNVVTIHHIVDTRDTPHPWIVMELVRGRSLQDRLAQGPMTPMEAAHLGRGLLSALHTAHAAGILHRDVKPANVLLREDGSPVLTDFGIAALHDTPGLTGTGELVGSPEYIAPERLRGLEGNPASDLWSLGLVLYTAVEGFNPMRRETSMATLAAVLNGQVPPPRLAGPLTPVLYALLTPDPNARPPAAQLDWMLAQAAGAPPGRVTDPTIPAPYHGKPRKGRGLAVGAAAAVLAVAASAVVGVVLVINAQSPSGTATPQASGPRVTATSEPTDEPSRGEPTGEEEVTAEPESLLTPDAVRTAIVALEKAAGTTRFTRMVVYGEYVIADAVVPGEEDVSDTFTYQNGEVTKRQGMPLRDGQKTTKLTSFNWDALPKLLRAADTKLGVKKPTSHYVIIEPASVFANNQPVFQVYVNDARSRGGYLMANAKGTILKLYPY